MATIFAALTGYSFSSIGSISGGEAIPAGQVYIAFSTTNAVGMISAGATDSFGKQLFIGQYTGPGFMPASPSVILVFVAIPATNAL